MSQWTIWWLGDWWKVLGTRVRNNVNYCSVEIRRYVNLYNYLPLKNCTTCPKSGLPTHCLKTTGLAYDNGFLYSYFILSRVINFIVYYFSMYRCSSLHLIYILHNNIKQRISTYEWRRPGIILDYTINFILKSFNQ